MRIPNNVNIANKKRQRCNAEVDVVTLKLKQRYYTLNKQVSHELSWLNCLLNNGYVVYSIDVGVDCHSIVSLYDKTYNRYYGFIFKYAFNINVLNELTNLKQLFL